MTKVRLAELTAAERVRIFPGDARQVSAARQFVARALAECPARESLLACVSELAANAVEHTDSGSGGTFTVTVGRPRKGVAFVAVGDEGSPDDPVTGGAGPMAESGRGLALVAAFSSRWGWRRTGRGHLVWAESTWPVSVRGPGSSPGAARRDDAGQHQDTWTNPLEPRDAA